MGSMSHHITPLVVNSLRGGHARTHTHIHTHTHTHTHTQTHTHTETRRAPGLKIAHYTVWLIKAAVCACMYD